MKVNQEEKRTKNIDLITSTTANTYQITIKDTNTKRREGETFFGETSFPVVPAIFQTPNRQKASHCVLNVPSGE